MKDKLSRLFVRRTLGEYVLYISLFLSVVLLDQLTKFLAVVFLEPLRSVPIIEGVIHLTFHRNRGAAFGILQDAPWVFNTFSVIAILAILLYLFLGHASTKLYAIPLTMIAGGGIGNMIDRTCFGSVVDFIHFKLIDFPIFNGADSFVCVGAGILILALVLDIIGEAKAEKAARAQVATEADSRTIGGTEGGTTAPTEGGTIGGTTAPTEGGTIGGTEAQNESEDEDE